MPRKRKLENDNSSLNVRAPKTAATKHNTQTKSVDEEVILQYGGSEWNVGEIKEKAINAYVAEGHRRGNIKKLALYLKPEERTAYYVVNDKMAGSVTF